jgi:GNAT superfamily N-acetyltransferase
MNISYTVDLKDGFYKNHDLLKEHELYEKTHKNSVFKSLLKINKDYFLTEQYSTVIAFYNDKPIGFILLEHYKNHDSGNFTFRKQKINFVTIGNLMMYVLPEHRGNSIAFKMTQLLEKSLTIFLGDKKESLINKYVIINSVSDAYSISSKAFKNLSTSYTGRNDTKNKADLISELTYHSPKQLFVT